MAPAAARPFYKRLAGIKHRLYPRRFQLQFSVHSTDAAVRRRLVPVDTLSLEEMAEYGREFFDPGGRKITLNFAVMEDAPIEAARLSDVFNPDRFLIKITPLNPTARAGSSGHLSLYRDRSRVDRLLAELAGAGFQVIESIGELEENAIGSNCGQYISALKTGILRPEASYTYQLVNP